MWCVISCFEEIKIDDDDAKALVYIFTITRVCNIIQLLTIEAVDMM